MIPKIIHPDAFDFGMPTVALIDTYSKGFRMETLQKRAAEFDTDLNEIERKPGYTYLHLITTGAQETYGFNNNGDGFPRESYMFTPFLNKSAAPYRTGGGMLEYHNPTFMEFGKVYKNHCFPGRTLVQSGEGSYKPIESYAQGDAVNTRKGPRAVSHIFKRPYKGAGVSVDCSDLRSFKCTVDHPVFVLRAVDTCCKHKYTILNKQKYQGHSTHCREWASKNKKEITSLITEVPAYSLQKGDWLVSHAVSGGTTSLPTYMARLIGWTAAEGYLAKNGCHIQYTISQKDQYAIDDICDCIKKAGYNVTLTPTKYGCIAINTGSKLLHHELSQYIKGTYSDKTLTAELFKLDNESKLHLLGAYVDGDGCYTKPEGPTPGYLRIRSSSPSMLRMLSDLVSSLGIAANTLWDNNSSTMISPTNGKTYKSNGSGYVSVASSDNLDMTDYSNKYVRVSIGRRRSAFVTVMLDDMRLHKIKDVSPCELDELVYNLEVEDAPEYFVEGLLVHNCNRHKNGTPSGYIVKAAYNNDMNRGELIVGVENDKWDKELQKVANEKPIFFSMAADVKYDICTACGNKASKLSDYCDHLKNDMLTITKEGHQIGAINDKPLFHDISGVFKPADKIAFALRKVASDRVLSSAELADLHGLAPRVDIMRKYAGVKSSNRIALLSKLAAIEKEILTATSDSPMNSLTVPFRSDDGKVKELENSTVSAMKNQDPGALFGSLKDKMVVLPMESFYKVTTGDNFDKVASLLPGAKNALNGVFGRMLNDPCIESLLEDGSYEPSGSYGGQELESEVSRLIGSHSLAASPINDRVIRNSISGCTGLDGGMLKCASEIHDAAADFLAREYARYVISFVDGLPEDKLNLTVGQTIANSI